MAYMQKDKYPITIKVVDIIAISLSRVEKPYRNEGLKSLKEG